MNASGVTVIMVGTGVILAASCEAVGGFVTEFEDRDEWFSAVGQVTTIDFTGWPDGTFITDQYADLGVLFTGGTEFIHLSNAFVNDGAGLSGFEFMRLEFDIPQFWIAADFPGRVQYELFSDDTLIYSSSGFGGPGTGHFGGLVSLESFDSVVILDPIDNSVNIDDLYFGVPAPATGSVLGLGMAALSRRRRRGERRWCNLSSVNSNHYHYLADRAKGVDNLSLS